MVSRGDFNAAAGVIALTVASLLIAVSLPLAPRLGLCLLYTSGVLTDQLLLGAGVGSLLWVLFGLILAQQTLGYCVSIQLQAVSGQLVADAGSHVYSHLQSLPMNWHHERQHGDVLALLTGDVYRLGSYVTGTLVPLVPLLFTFIGALAMMLRFAPVSYTHLDVYKRQVVACGGEQIIRRYAVHQAANACACRRMEHGGAKRHGAVEGLPH